MRLKALFAGVLLAVVLLACGCAYAENMEQAYTDAVRLDMDGLNDEEAVITRGEAALPELLQATAPGELVQENAKAYSGTTKVSSGQPYKCRFGKTRLGI